MHLDWLDDRAACKGSPQLFRPTNVKAVIDKAKATCATCPLLERCRDHGLRHEHEGVWGGLSEKQRRVERRRLGIQFESIDYGDERRG